MKNASYESIGQGNGYSVRVQPETFLKAITELKSEGKVISPKRCYYAVRE
jgi:hypothetical protein